MTQFPGQLYVPSCVSLLFKDYISPAHESGRHQIKRQPKFATTCFDHIKLEIVACNCKFWACANTQNDGKYSVTHAHIYSRWRLLLLVFIINAIYRKSTETKKSFWNLFYYRGGGGEGLMYDLSRDVPLRKSRPILSRSFYTKFCQKKDRFLNQSHKF